MIERPERALRIGREIGSGDFDVALAAGHDPGARRIDESLAVRLEYVPERTSGHHGGRLHVAGFEEGRSEVGQRHHIVHHAATFDARAGEDERDTGAESVEVTLAVREAGGAVVAAYGDERAGEFAGPFEFREQDAHCGVEGLNFAEIVGEVFAHDRNVGQEGR